MSRTHRGSRKLKGRGACFNLGRGEDDVVSVRARVAPYGKSNLRIMLESWDSVQVLSGLRGKAYGKVPGGGKVVIGGSISTFIRLWRANIKKEKLSEGSR